MQSSFQWFCVPAEATMIPVLLAVFIAGANALTDADRKVALDAHNNYRKTLASGSAVNKGGAKLLQGADVNLLKYDTGIEAIAQKWASGCVFQHSSSSQRNNTGENLYWYSTSQDASTALKAAADLWWKELADYGISNPSNPVLTSEEFNRGIGHWSQMAWAKTTKIGCGVQTCTSQGGFTIVVCNYSPA
ncbi:venom allergen-like protein vap-2 [Aphelenchoides avenae]|nr:venom allergen-like protein vap-2 [Aphelenchus avenae]